MKVIVLHIKSASPPLRRLQDSATWPQDRSLESKVGSVLNHLWHFFLITCTYLKEDDYDRSIVQIFTKNADCLQKEETWKWHSIYFLLISHLSVALRPKGFWEQLLLSTCTYTPSPLTPPTPPPIPTPHPLSRAKHPSKFSPYNAVECAAAMRQREFCCDSNQSGDIGHLTPNYHLL